MGGSEAGGGRETGEGGERAGRRMWHPCLLAHACPHPPPLPRPLLPLRPRAQGAHQRCFRQLLMAGKVEELVSTARTALADGHCVVVGLQSTGEAVTQQQSELNDGDFEDL